MAWELSILAFILLAVVTHNWRRARLYEIKELVPNCLLTTYPLVFVSGKRSLFYFLGYWNSLPHWLASHGYEVFNLNLAWKNPFQRKLKLSEFLQKTSLDGGKIHLLIDSSSYFEFTEILTRSETDCLASITCLGGSPSESQKVDLEISSLVRLPIPIEEIEISSAPKLNPIFWQMYRWSS